MRVWNKSKLGLPDITRNTNMNKVQKTKGSMPLPKFLDPLHNLNFRPPCESSAFTVLHHRWWKTAFADQIPQGALCLDPGLVEHLLCS